MATNDERRFLRDLDLPETGDGVIRITTTGDLRDVTGIDNLKKAQRRRALTTPGSLVHRSLYGGGLELDVEEASSPASRSEAANRIRRNALRDPRVADASVTLVEGTSSDPLDGSSVTATINVRARGEDTESAGIEVEV